MQQKKVMVALSGGVDSAVSAALLLRAGYKVEGVYLKYASEVINGFVKPDSCSWQEDLDMVERVGKHLNIPVRSVNIEQEYNEKVIVPFLEAYQCGRTPNPDILCNRHIKFHWFLNWARNQGADAIATGHYTQNRYSSGSYHLLAGSDTHKDQSYFLYTLTQKVLQSVLFPLGTFRKPMVRAFASALGLPNATRKDSQGVCFVGEVKVREFVASRLNDQPGPIVDTKGNLIGTHSGISYFTIGQRHGLGIGGGTPFYVLAKEPQKRILVVARGSDDPSLLSFELQASNATWVQAKPPATSFRCLARIRHGQPLNPATVRLLDENRVAVTFHSPQRAAAPGQAVVFYQDDEVLGGATIEEVFHLDHYNTL